MVDHGAIVEHHEVEFLGDDLALSPRSLPLMGTENIHIFHDWGEVEKYSYAPGGIVVRDSTATEMRTNFPFEVRDLTQISESVTLFSQGKLSYVDATETPVYVSLYIPISFFEVRDVTGTRLVARLPGLRIEDSTATRLTYLEWDPWGLEIFMDGDVAHLTWDGEAGRRYWIFRTKVGPAEVEQPSSWSELPSTWSEMPATWGDNPPVPLGLPGAGVPSIVDVPEYSDGPLPPGEYAWQVFEENPMEVV